ncbi:MAG: histidine kinase [Phaeodactylibacter sp.]|nr:histidine kinase [Phaeodactylibacter sp.]MCB9052764.1 histidine kinase [Lewinellaceae bacterium]
MKRFLHPACYLLLWVFIFPLSLPAQYHLTKTYTVQDGLPFTEVSNCLISKEGYLYLMTTVGHRLVFDGFSFREFSKGETIKDFSSGQYMTEDQHGVWMIIGKNIYLYRGFKETKVEAPPIKNRFLDENNNLLTLICPDNQLWSFDPKSQRFKRLPDKATGRPALDKSFSFSGIAKFGKYWEIGVKTDSGERFVLESDEVNKSRKELHFPKAVNTLYPLSTEALLVSLFEKPGDPSEVKTYVYRSGQMTPLEGGDWMGRRRQFTGYYFFPFRDKIFLYGRPPTGIAQSRDDLEIWEVSPSGKAIFRARFRLSAILHPLRIQMDGAGNFWLPSQGGLVKVFPAFLGCFESNPNMAGGLHSINEGPEGNIWFGFYRHGFSKFNGDEVIRVPQSSPFFTHIMPGTWRDEAGYMYFFNESWYGLFKTNGQEWRRKNSEERLTGGYFYPLSNKEQLALGLYRNKGLGLMDYPFEPENPIRFIDSLKGMSLVNVQTITEDRGKRIWMGKLGQGVSVYDPKLDTAVTWLIQNEGDVEAISSLIDSRGNLWLGTSKGLALLPSPEKIDLLQEDINDYITRLSLPESGGGIVSFLKEHQGYLCFGDSKGVGLLSLNSFYQDPGHPRAHYFNTVGYLPGGASEQNTILISRDGHIWMGNDQGAIRLDLGQLVLDTSSIYLDSLLFFHGRNEQSAAQANVLDLPRGQRNLSFYWSSTFDRQLIPNRWLSYRLILASGDTLLKNDYLLAQNTNLGYIPPGNHRLELTLFKDNQANDQKTIRLIIPKNLEDTWWFWSLISIFLVMTVSAVLWLVYTKKRQQQQYELATEKLKREKEELQIQAITNSLNPHFLNNTLHWVQAKVRRDAVASMVIDKLAENIRSVFQRSRNREAFHSLQEEMKLVKNYLSIQAKRFDGRYQFILPTEEEMMKSRHIMVPLMQILIHTENAIERGLRNRKESSFLRIALEDEGHSLKVMIEDDGIGYSNALKNNIKGTQQGTQMLYNLHDIFNPRNVRKIISTIEDNIYFSSDTGVRYGTRINILIPKQFTYELETDRGPGSRG